MQIANICSGCGGARRTKKKKPWTIGVKFPLRRVTVNIPRERERKRERERERESKRGGERERAGQNSCETLQHTSKAESD